MPPKKRARTQEIVEQENQTGQEIIEKNTDAEREHTEGQLEEGEMVKLLKDRVAQNDTDAMLLLAECYALGRETPRNIAFADMMISVSAAKGNKDAKSLVRLIKKWKKEPTMDMARLLINI